MRCIMGLCKSVLWAQMLGDRNWLAAKIGSGAAVDKLKLHPHGAVRMPFIYHVRQGNNPGGLQVPTKVLSASCCLLRAASSI